MSAYAYAYVKVWTNPKLLKWESMIAQLQIAQWADNQIQWYNS